MERKIPRIIHLHFLCLCLLNLFTTTGKYLLFNLSKIVHKISRFALGLALGSLFSLLGMSCLIKSLNKRQVYALLLSCILVAVRDVKYG